MPVAYAWFVLSGGPGNPNPRLSLGGPASRDHGGLVFSQSASPTSADTIPGLTVIGGDGIPLGIGSMVLDYGAGTLTWTDSTSTAYVQALGGDGYYRFASPSFSLMFHLVTSQLPSGTNTVYYNISKNKQNLFDNVLFSERSSNHTNYRCLYLYNGFPESIVDVTISVNAPPSYGAITIGSEYVSGLTGTVSQIYAESAPIAIRGNYRLSAHSPTSLAEITDFYSTNGPFLQAAFPSLFSLQESDGISVEIPTAIVDEYDSTGILAPLSWKSSLSFPVVPQGKYVSFWLKRYVGASTTGSSLIEDGFTIQLAYRRD